MYDSLSARARRDDQFHKKPKCVEMLTSNHLTLRQLGPPVSTRGPCLMRPIEDGGRAALVRGIVGEQCAILIWILSTSSSLNATRRPTQARLVILIGIGKVEIPVKLPVIELHRHGIVCLLVDCPDSTGQVQACAG